MDNEIKRILCDSDADNGLTLIRKDEYVSYYTKGGFLDASDKQKKEKRGEAYAFITSELCSMIESVFIENSFLEEIPIEWTVVGVCSHVRNHMYQKKYGHKSIVSLPKTIEFIAMEGKGACYGFVFDIDEDNAQYKSVINSTYPVDGAVFTKDGKELLSCGSKKPNDDYLQGVNRIGHMSIEESCDLSIPSSVESISSAHLRCGTLKFEGNLPELGDFSDVRVEKIYINQPLKQISPESYKKIADVKYGEQDYYRAEIITKKPELSTVVPWTPGFIGLTRVDNDEYEYINPRYIIKMKPVSFEKYDGKKTGTRILFAAHGSERAIAVDYYERLIVIDIKIQEAQEALAKSIGGLAGLLEKVNDLYELSQKERF